MKRWIVLIVVVLFLVALALTVRWWLPPILAFVGANSDLIQGLEAALQLTFAAVAAAVAVIGYLRGRREKQTPVVQIDQGDKTVEARAKDSGMAVSGDVSDSTLINANVVVVADRWLRTLRRGASPEALRRATEEYLRYLLDRHRYLNLKGVGPAERIPLRLPLLDLYVPLKARVELPEGETWRRELRLAGRPLAGSVGDQPEPGAEEQGALASHLSEPQPALGLLQRYDGLIVLGDPGAGKTTFLKYLALRLAAGEGDALGLGERLPVLVPLSAYATALNDGDVRLDDFMARYLHDIGSDLPMADLLAAALTAGRALVLLDGLDEVKELALRHTVAERVADFYALHRRAGNKFVLTSRVVGYRAVRPTAEGLVECTLVDFDDDEIADFVARWTAALERQAQGVSAVAQADAARERRELLDAIQRNPSVRRLAANPLLLTILALMKRQGVTLPERRVELYDQYVRTLLSTWNRARSLSGRMAAPDLDVVQTVRMLAPLALWMHEVAPGVGLVKREDLRRKLEAIYADRGEANPEAAAHRLLEDVREHAALLLERGPGEYGFIHLTFEEYLAAVAIALAAQGSCRPVVARLAPHVGDPAWHEVALLAVGYLGISQQLDRVAGDVVEALITEQPGPRGEAVVLAGEAVLDARPVGVPRSSKNCVVAALVTTMQDAAVPATLRRRAGLLLGHLDWQPADLAIGSVQALDEFVEVPAGKFLYGDDKRERRITERFWIAKYPVTNLQYARFMADHGYDRREFWSDDGWMWRDGNDSDLSFIQNKEDRESYRNWLVRRPPDKRQQPFWWDDLDENNPITPVVGVSWFEAEAYCNWLNDRLTAMPLAADQSVVRPSRYIVHLPTEEEWERAARGTDGREYPWVGDFNLANANVAEEIGRGSGTTAVCTYPQGASPVGVWDMSGNVWEWTSSYWSPKVLYRVVRGGSWYYDQRLARCAFRLRRVSDLCDALIGLRVVVSLSS
ncbi:MAG: SUMF1/EgtB/PvdO family nonheme iron enzyme [Chloroflexi bacterium]|nr:SUMF1/EgtB/PvdO family nonheme iron enzyme [Chloroflexota bacterium]